MTGLRRQWRTDTASHRRTHALAASPASRSSSGVPAAPRADRPVARGPASVFDQRTQIGRDLAAVDWTATPLGPVESWSESLRNVVRTHLASRFAMWMA